MRDNRNSNNGEDNNNNNISNNDGAYNHNDNTNDNNINTNSEDNGSIIRRFWAWRHKNRIVINGNYGNDDCNINSNGNTLLLLLSPSPSFFYIKVNERMLFNKKSRYKVVVVICFEKVDDKEQKNSLFLLSCFGITFTVKPCDPNACGAFIATVIDT